MTHEVHHEFVHSNLQVQLKNLGYKFQSLGRINLCSREIIQKSNSIYTLNYSGVLN